MKIEQLSNRWENLERILREKGAECFITAAPTIIQYLTGFLPDVMNPCILAVKGNGAMTLIAPEGTQICHGEVLEYCAYSVDAFQNPVKNAGSLLKGLMGDSFCRIGLYMKKCPGWVVQEMIRQGKEAIDISEELDSLMTVKDSSEVEAIRRTLALNRLAYDRVRDIVKRGMTEIELYKEIGGAFNWGAETPITFIADLVSGPRAVEISGPPTMREFQCQDTIIVDLLPCRQGYYSDTTRTFFMGSPSEEQRKAYEVLQTALQTGADALRPGIMAEDIYVKVAGVIEEKGYGGCFPHHAGHGIGTGFFEAPYFIKRCPIELKTGMVVTLEPGIYLPGKFGIRIENNYLITSDGCENLFEYPLDIEAFVVDGR